MRRWWPLVLLVMTVPTALPAEDVACRPNALGSVGCPALLRPKPRPPLLELEAQGLDRLLPPPEARPGQVFVPARETDRLGGTTILDGGTTVCRPDALGNLNCR